MQRIRLAVAAALLTAAASAHAGDDPKPPAPAPGAPAAPAAPGTAAKHENKITPEAKAAFEKMGKIANNPVAKGLKDASGTIGAAMGAMTLSMKFTFKAPDTVKVEPDESAEGPMKMAGRQMAGGMERSLKAMLGIFHPAEGEEYDASVASADGKDVLTIVSYAADAEKARTAFTLDANGLPASSVSTSQVEFRGEKHEMKSETTFTWTKVGDVYRLDKLHTTRGAPPAAGGAPSGGEGGRRGGGMGADVTISFTYADVEGFSIATSWKTEMPGGMTSESQLSDLTVNGKKIETKTAEPPKKDAPKAGKGKGGKNEDDDDDDDEGGEKHGKK
jgi:hypothetical protein